MGEAAILAAITRFAFIYIGVFLMNFIFLIASDYFMKIAKRELMSEQEEVILVNNPKTTLIAAPEIQASEVINNPKGTGSVKYRVGSIIHFPPKIETIANE
jgi:beta-lactamase regulating signal transducer with metallopeptidase domain